jgi:5-bromo-4-chloroindolyl phosphate hydrolysis protein
MGSRRCGHGHNEFENMGGNNCGSHRGPGSLVGLVFAIVSFAITLAFKIVEVVFQTLFGLLSGMGAGSRNTAAVSNENENTASEQQNVKYTINDIKQEAASSKAEDKKNRVNSNNVRNFKKADSSKPKEASEAMAADSEKHSGEVKNKDFYVVLFILTIIPAIVALAMGKLLYAGMIGAAGFGLMMIAGIIDGIASGLRKRSAEKNEKEETEEAKEEDSVEILIKDAFEKLFVIRKDIDKIEDAETRAKIEAVCSTGEKIIGEVRTNPEGLTYVRKFFYYYLDAFGEIVKKYLRLSTFEASSEEVGKLVAETEKSFADIDAIFKDLCEKLLEKDMMNLKAEINVIKNSN